MSEASKRKEKQKWAIEKKKKKPRLDTARKFRGIHFIDPADEESKDIMKNARRKLEVPMPAAMPCKLQRDKYRKPVALKRSARQNTFPLSKLAAKGTNSLSHCNLVHKFIPMPQAFKIPVVKAAVEKWQNLRKYQHGS